MLKTYRGGDKVQKGFYASMKRWTIELMKTDGEALLGAPDEKYFRLPTIVMLFVSPLAGAAFVIFLPLIGFLLLGAWAIRRVTGKPPEGKAEPVEPTRKAA